MVTRKHIRCYPLKFDKMLFKKISKKQVNIINYKKLTSTEYLCLNVLLNITLHFIDINLMAVVAVALQWKLFNRQSKIGLHRIRTIWDHPEGITHKNNL